MQDCFHKKGYKNVTQLIKQTMSMQQFNELPRDVRLYVISKLDMDGRIKCGIVGKLSVPHKLSIRLRRVYTWKLYLIVSGDTFAMSHPWSLCLSHLDMASPQEWLDRWYTQELPKLFRCACYWKPYHSDKDRELLLGAV